MFESVGRNNVALSSFTKEDALFAQRRLAKLILHNTPTLAVDEWISTSMALTELDREFEMFRPFVTCVVKRLLELADWGVRLRVIFGAVLSVSNMGTDINMVNEFYNNGEGFAGIATIGMLTANVLTQILFAYVQNLRKPWRYIFFDGLYVVTYIKPAVDAHRVLKGGVKDPNVTFFH